MMTSSDDGLKEAEEVIKPTLWAEDFLRIIRRPENAGRDYVKEMMESTATIHLWEMTPLDDLDKDSLD